MCLRFQRFLSNKKISVVNDPIKPKLESKVKVTVRENVSENYEKIVKNSTINIFENKAYHLIEHFIAFILIPNLTILDNRYSKNFSKEIKYKSASD